MKTAQNDNVDDLTYVALQYCIACVTGQLLTGLHQIR
jgi:hypothetical protein